MCCCVETNRATPSPARWRTGLGRLLEWGLPVATLALVPKCPACVAAWVLVATGMGISFSAATGLRWGVMGVAVAALSWAGHRAVRRLRATA
jgi:hypothetical protein